MADLKGHGGVSGPYDPERAQAALVLIRSHEGGYLTVSDGRRDACFLFGRTGIRAALLGVAPPPLGKLLARRARLKPSQRELLEAAPPGREREALRRGGLPEELLEEAARDAIGQLLLDVLFWDGPWCEAGAGETVARDRLHAPGVRVLSAAGGQADVLAGALERLPKAEAVLRAGGGVRVSLVTTGEARAREHLAGCAGTLEADVLERILARPGVRGAELLEALACGEMLLAGNLTRLSEAGVVQGEPAPPDPAEQLAAAEAGLGEALCESARELWLGEACGRAGERLRASRHLARVGWTLLRAKRRDEAHERFQQALRWTPGDLEALLGRVTALWELERAEDAAHETQTLARTLLDLGLPTQAQRALVPAVQSSGSLALELLLLEALVAQGERRAAEALGQSLLPRLEGAGRKTDARRAREQLAGLGGPAAPTLRAPPRVGPALRAATGVAALAALGASAALAVSWRELSRRQTYAQKVATVRAWLETGASLEQVGAEFPARMEGGDAVGLAVAALRERIASLSEEEAALPRLQERLRHSWEDSSQQFLVVIDEALAAKPSEALAAPLRDLRGAALAHEEEARGLYRRLKEVVRRRELADTWELSRRLLDRFRNVPDPEARTLIEVVSEPPGAEVRLAGVAVGRAPLVVQVALDRTTELDVQLGEGLARRVEVDPAALTEPRVRVTGAGQ